MLGTILLIILILLVIGALPTWGYSGGWGYFPSGGLGLVLVGGFGGCGGWGFFCGGGGGGGGVGGGPALRRTGMPDRAPRLSHLLETSIYVADLDRAQGFYQRVLGLELFLRDDRMSALGLPGSAVLLLFAAGGSAAPTPTEAGGDIPPPDGGGRVHLCLALPRTELEVWNDHLAAHDVPVESRITWPAGGTSLYVRDPDGSLLELATPGLWPSW